MTQNDSPKNGGCESRSSLRILISPGSGSAHDRVEWATSPALLQLSPVFAEVKRGKNRAQNFTTINVSSGRDRTRFRADNHAR